MKTRLLLLAACMCACVHALSAQVYTGTALQNSAGNVARIVPFAPVTVCVSSDTNVPCTQKATIFTDSTLSAPCTLTAGNGAPLSGSGCNNPGAADANGNFTFFATPGNYRICSYAQNYVCVMVPAGSSANFNCGTTANPGIPFWNGTACLIDTNAQLDGNGNLTVTSVTASGTITGGKLATSGPGGILALQLQAAPTVPSSPLGLAYVYANTSTGLLDCLKFGQVECFSGLQIVATGTAALSTSSVSSGGCNTTTVAASGVLTSSKIVATPNVDPTGVTGYGPSASGSLYVQAWPTANNVNFKVCNNTGSPITPGALTVDWTAF